MDFDVKEITFLSKKLPFQENSIKYLTLCREHYEKATNAYAIITPLRLLLLEELNGDQWHRSNQLMDHQEGTVKLILKPL